jgi:hypothetical protein
VYHNQNPEILSKNPDHGLEQTNNMGVVGFTPVFSMLAYITNGELDSNSRQYIAEMSLNNVGHIFQ